MPDQGRMRPDSGYFVQMWKPHSVSAVPVRNCLVDAGFLIDALRAGNIPEDTPIAFLGEWLGAIARRWGKRVAYSPFLAGSTTREWQDFSGDALRDFLTANQDLIPDERYYSQQPELAMQALEPS